jgi:prepilin-type N-terminal cleavage/methylation domain-containing protein
MRTDSAQNEKGVTLIELLIVLVISVTLVGGIYRLFVAQTRAYTVQDQVVEVQQSIRGGMEIILRDLRMAGYDSDSLSSKISIPSPPIAVTDSSLAVDYEYDDTTRYTVAYVYNAGTSELHRLLTRTKDDGTVIGGGPEDDTVLTNVTALAFTYGLDSNGDGVMDDRNANGTIDDDDWVTAAGVGSTKVVAVRVTLTARATEVNPDLDMTSPRTLVTAITLRNQCLSK